MRSLKYQVVSEATYMRDINKAIQAEGDDQSFQSFLKNLFIEHTQFIGVRNINII